VVTCHALLYIRLGRVFGLWGRRDEKCLAADPPLENLIYKTPVTVREPAPWTGLYGGLNAGYGWGHQPIQETGDAVTGGQFRGNLVRAGVNYRFYGDDSDY
jgi:hypothetical protein